MQVRDRYYQSDHELFGEHPTPSFDFLPSSARGASQHLSINIRRDLVHMVDYLSANRPAERSVPSVLLQPRTERTSARARGPRQTLSEVLTPALGTSAKLRVSPERAKAIQRPHRGKSRKTIGGMAWAYWR